jgi:hypothetical protein
VAKLITACPFSNRSCKECPIYVGRHSQICIAPRYRNGGGGKPKPTYGCTTLIWELPADLADCRTFMRDIEDREENIKAATIVWK